MPTRIPKGAPRPRQAVLQMAPYSPPTGNRAGKLRLDFNENTVGCSPRIIEFLKQQLDVVSVDNGTDYRRLKMEKLKVYHVGSDTEFPKIFDALKKLRDLDIACELKFDRRPARRPSRSPESSDGLDAFSQGV